MPRMTKNFSKRSVMSNYTQGPAAIQMNSFYNKTFLSHYVNEPMESPLKSSYLQHISDKKKKQGHQLDLNVKNYITPFESTIRLTRLKDTHIGKTILQHEDLMQQFDQDVKSSIDLQDPLLMQSSIRQQKKIVQKWWLLQRVSSHAEEA